MRGTDPAVRGSTQLRDAVAARKQLKLITHACVVSFVWVCLQPRLNHCIHYPHRLSIEHPCNFRLYITHTHTRKLLSSILAACHQHFLSPSLCSMHLLFTFANVRAEHKKSLTRPSARFSPPKYIFFVEKKDAGRRTTRCALTDTDQSCVEEMQHNDVAFQSYTTFFHHVSCSPLRVIGRRQRRGRGWREGEGGGRPTSDGARRPTRGAFVILYNSTLELKPRLYRMRYFARR